MIKRPYRIAIQPLHRIRFDLKLEHAVVALRVVNVSVSGMGFLKGSFDAWEDLGEQLTGLITVDEASFDTSLMIVHITGSLVGCRFLQIQPRLERAIRQYFSYELAAGSLTMVNPAMLRGHPDGEPVWLTGSENCELFLVHQDNAVQRFHMNIFGNYLEGKKGELARMGHVVESVGDNTGGSIQYKGSSLIRFESQLSEDVLNIARRFIASAAKLDPPLKQGLLRMLEESTSGT